MKINAFSKSFVVGLGCFLTCGALAAQSIKERRLFSSSDPSGAGLEWVVSETMFCSTKPWSPESEAPPLATTAAVQAAIKVRPPKKRWMITDVSVQASACGREFRWYYKIEMYEDAGTAAEYPPDTVQQVVLMDGSVLASRPLKR